MLFNSIDFAIFLPLVFLLYWFVFKKHLRLQNLLVVVASYVFYGWWDWRFLSLIFLSSIVDYSAGLGMRRHNESPKARKVLLLLSIAVNLGALGFFKYWNFFQDSFVDAFLMFGMDIQPNSLNIILPVGISFYTFQTLSYTIDVYKRKLEPTKDFIAFLAFVSFFPQLVAGPIERATHLLPQFYVPRKFEYAKAVDGLRQILWGLFAKVVVADNCAEVANLVFNDSDSYSGSTLIIGVIAFSFQIYGDFSGYSHIAIGVSRLFGFDLMQNFATPYFSRDIAEFWRRWHVSLSTWFRDYLYIPLGGSRVGPRHAVINILAVFLISGLWHGANWTFVVWGGLNAIYFLPLVLINRHKTHIDIVAKGKLFPSLRDLLKIGVTYILTLFAWVFFRSETVPQALDFIANLASRSLLSVPDIRPLFMTLFITIFLVFEWLGREQPYALAGIRRAIPHAVVRWPVYLGLTWMIFLFGVKAQQFIYFQF